MFLKLICLINVYKTSCFPILHSNEPKPCLVFVRVFPV